MSNWTYKDVKEGKIIVVLNKGNQYDFLITAKLISEAFELPIHEVKSRIAENDVNYAWANTTGGYDTGKGIPNFLEHFPPISALKIKRSIDIFITKEERERALSFLEKHEDLL